MRNLVVVLVILATASSAWATGVVPHGVTGLWRFQTAVSEGGPATMAATIGADMINSCPPTDPLDTDYNGYWFMGPWTSLGVPWNGDAYADAGVSQERSLDYLTVNPSFTANGGGSYVNQYTVAIDYVQTTDGPVWEGNRYNSLFQTADTGNGNDGDLFMKCAEADGHTTSTIGVSDTGYSTLTFDASTWHRIVWSVDNGDDTGAGGFFRVYVDGTLFLDAPGQKRDKRMSLYTDHFHLFADNDWEDAWGLVGTVATWDRALNTAEISNMGGWLNGSDSPTGLWWVNPGDINMDGFVNEVDAQTLASHWGTSEMPVNEFTGEPLYDSWWKLGDFNFDERVDALDASLMAANWTGGGAESGTVPEPSTLALLAMGVIGLLACVRRRG